MSEFHDYDPRYEFLAQHGEEEGKTKRKKLWKVFWILLAVTIVELVIGFYNSHFSGAILKVIFIGLTIYKAYYIVAEFMHLGHEAKGMRVTIIVPYAIFAVYLIYICLVEGVYSKVHRSLAQKDTVENTKHIEKKH